MSTSEPVARHVYGPVPSRRLGRSLGVDVIPYKVCSYDCVYCQLGRTTCKTVEQLTLEGAVRHDRRSGGPFYRAVREAEVRA